MSHYRLISSIYTYDGNFGHGCVYLQITADQNNKMLLYEKLICGFNLCNRPTDILESQFKACGSEFTYLEINEKYIKRN